MLSKGGQNTNCPYRYCLHVEFSRCLIHLELNQNEKFGQQAAVLTIIFHSRLTNRS